MSRLQLGSAPGTCGRSHHQTRLVALTGGAGAGKTAVLELALRTFCPHVGVLREAAGAEYWAEVGTARGVELARSVADQGYNRDNVLQVESADEVQILDERILAAWDGHPRRVAVAREADLVLGATRALEQARSELPPCCHAHAPNVSGT